MEERTCVCLYMAMELFLDWSETCVPYSRIFVVDENDFPVSVVKLIMFAFVQRILKAMAAFSDI